MTAFYNEWDGFAAAWLRELIAAGHLPEGEVNERSIADLDAGSVRPVSHFFAGIGGWPHALRLAGWQDHWPVWTASLPCQPFSVAGKGLGTDDERHLAPVFLRLVGECRPPVIFGEQVASAAGRAWFADLRLQMEAMGYAVACADLCAASVGAPQIRQRLFWGAVRLENAGRERRDGEPIRLFAGGQDEAGSEAAGRGATGGLADADDAGPQGRDGMPERPDEFAPGAGGVEGRMADDRGRPRALHGGWSDADWLLCRDGKWRPVEPGTFPLADGIPGRVGRLRGYGNAIVPQVAAEFIVSFTESIKEVCNAPTA